MRLLFIDGWNSFWHFVFGCMSVFSWQITAIFSAYQLLDPFETNILVDFSEFFLGHNLMIVFVFSNIFYMYNTFIESILGRTVHQTKLDISQIRNNVSNHQEPVILHVNFQIVG